MQGINLKEELLQREDISRGNKLLIDPDNLFWALTFGKSINKDTGQKVFSLYARMKDKLDVLMHDFRFKMKLNSVYINPTDRCNADCPYCYVPASRRKKGKDLSQKGLLYILDRVDRYFRNNPSYPKIKPIIIYHGSEPLLVRDRIFSSIEKFRKRFHFGIQTNAILLTKADVEFLMAHKVSVGLSLDSINKGVNDYTRRSSQGSNYEKVIQALEWFNGYEGLNIITTITKHNVAGLAKLVSFAHSKKVSCILLNPVRATRKSTQKLRPSQEDLTKNFIKAVKTAIDLSKSSGRRIIIANFSNIILGIVAPLARRLMCDISPCGGGRCFFAITAGGNMIPCGEFIALKGFYGGNIFRSSIKKAINSAPFKKVRSRMVEKISECDTCAYRNICGAPCPAEVYSLSKDLNIKSPYCDFYKDIIKYAFKLISEDKIKYLFRKKALENIKYEYRLGK